MHFTTEQMTQSFDATAAYLCKSWARTVPSRDELSTTLPAGLNTTLVTAAECSANVTKHNPVLVFHSLTWENRQRRIEKKNLMMKQWIWNVDHRHKLTCTNNKTLEFHRTHTLWVLSTVSGLCVVQRVKLLFSALPSHWGWLFLYSIKSDSGHDNL